MRDYKEDPRQRLVRLDGGARTLISHYRSGYAFRSEFVWRQPDGSLPVVGGEMPRFFTARECARLQGFPETHILGEVGEAGGKGNGNRLYHQLGNAVCPAVVAAIANSLLTVTGRSNEDSSGLLGGVHGRQKSEDRPATETAVMKADSHECGLRPGPSPRRNLAAPAIRLLLRASADPDSAHYASTGRLSLSEQCASFLRCDDGAPGGSTGCGESFTRADAETVMRLLTTGQPRAVADGLHSLGRAAHVRARGWVLNFLESGLLPLLVECLSVASSAAALASAASDAASHSPIVTGITAEAQRLAVTALVEMSKNSAEVKLVLRDNNTAMAALRAFGESAVGPIRDGDGDDDEAGGGGEGPLPRDPGESSDSCAYDGDRLRQQALALVAGLEGSGSAPNAKRRKL